MEYEAIGLSFDAPAQRIAKLKEVVALVKAHCGGAPLDHAGDYVNVAGYQGTPPSVQRPHPPIMIGGGRRKMLSYAAIEADIVSVNSVPFVAHNDDGLTPAEEAVRRLHYLENAAPTRIGDLEIESSPYFISMSDDTESAYQHIATKTGIGVDVLRDHPNVLAGSVEAITETLQQRRETYGVNYVTVQQSQAEKFAPIVARLTGT